jgi:hypothetical protein
MRAPALGQLTPLPGDLARIPNFDFSGHDRRNEYAMDDDAIRSTFTRNQRNAGRTNHRFGPGSACRAAALGATAIVEMGQSACGKLEPKRALALIRESGIDSASRATQWEALVLEWDLQRVRQFADDAAAEQQHHDAAGYPNGGWRGGWRRL